jgi:putative ABC transport system substrate-binding protein
MVTAALTALGSVWLERRRLITRRLAARYLEPVLKGANPGDLPVQQPTRFELFVNLRTANALGLNIPESFLLRADKVIE